MKKGIVILLLLLSTVATLTGLTSNAPNLPNKSVFDSVGWFPEKENHLVYDYCHILTNAQRSELENRLLKVNDSTSNQIVVMITPGFGGKDISSFAFEVGNKWGVGQESFRNGLVVVVKPKDESYGEVEIATGTGLEGALPDIFCKRIIEDKMIPLFRENDYYGGIVAALDILIPVCTGEYSYSKYKKDNDVNPVVVIIITLCIIGLIIFLLYKLGKSSNGNGGGGYSGGKSHWGGWSGGGWSGGSSRGGSFGGFGGFGGGTFSGGGARGRW